MKLLAVTACPTGFAHTYMAAEALEQAAAAAGHEIVVENQGSAGSNPFTEVQLAEAEAIILAADVGIRDKERFAHLPQVRSSVKKAICGADDLVAQAVETARRTEVAVPAQRAVKESGPGPGARSAAG